MICSSKNKRENLEEKKLQRKGKEFTDGGLSQNDNEQYHAN